ncbi:MAG: hypothetical protein ABW352_21245 [Polyangiales bacterium]
MARASTPAHPHPITSEHERMQQGQALLGALNDALDLADASRLRTLIEHLDALDPEDAQRLREGYERIADCLDAPTPQARDDARANAASYYRDARASVLRRYVRRHCLSES